jgi:hypothetical protein
LAAVFIRSDTLDALYEQQQQANKDKLTKLHASALKTVRSLVKARADIEVISILPSFHTLWF